MKRQVKRHIVGRQPLPRRRFLQVLLGILGGLGLPVWGRPRQSRQPSGREADFYRVKDGGDAS